MKKPELLMPAGNIEKLKYGIKYGADAVYLGVVDFSLRAMRKGELITLENLKTAINTAHSMNTKAYLTLNIFAFNKDIKALENAMEIITETNPDALIISDVGIMRLAQKYMPKTDIHISTQANILNYEAVRFWQDMGATRAILARELPIKDVAEIKQKIPDMELECFIHGAQCVSFSGRCLLSDYMTNGERKANSGNCSQPCRWSYKLLEETRPNEYQEIIQDDKGTHILSTKDLCLVKHLKNMIDAGIDSFKVEGRTKSLYYVSATAKAYREAIDAVMQDRNSDMEPYFQELLKVGNRGYTTGFYLGNGEYPSDGYSYDISKGLAGADFLCEFWDKKDDLYKIKTKNKFNKNEDIEIITPTEKFITQITEIKNENGDELELANTNGELWVKLSVEPQNYEYALARTIGIKGKIQDNQSCECCQF
ncbi:MAG: U32 family peptidase C-terminal domain-containing protein [bacterium]|nr:U32 family peptidase C-terminal domain-containing protein [bacterium]